ncbi:adenylate kinase 4, mitochondrial-like [Teleopsis dalmanni]|uniref:adenylate kinase 4, mitochondrial-like n=1 Tax=Teleopsis dalmanni TaxID=139649 RepID=UPI0018CE9F48|nr:adenylate kinase 4, mitochondrial-like [Teleopsis dalmanni]XP_037942669.1 adenylate kinase 4, mitochondrial-like [Teleopsis dalmanni]
MSAIFNAIVVGAPACGKTTIAKFIANKFDFLYLCPREVVAYHISMRTIFGTKTKKYMYEGRTVPDDLIFDTMLDCIEKFEGKSWVLDSYPRTIKQAKKLQDMACVDAAINLILPPEKIVERSKKRWVQLPSGRAYSMDYNLPRERGVDNITGLKIVQLPKDRPEVVKKRLESYEIRSKPVMKYLENHFSLTSFNVADMNVKAKIEDFIIAKFCKKICGERLGDNVTDQHDEQAECS